MAAANARGEGVRAEQKIRRAGENSTGMAATNLAARGGSASRAGLERREGGGRGLTRGSLHVCQHSAVGVSS
jgi:hypothetical protein